MEDFESIYGESPSATLNIDKATLSILKMELQLVYETDNSPISLAQNNTNTDVYIAEQIGIIRKVNLVSGSSEVFLDLTDLIVPLRKKYDERGLLDIAFHPNYPEDNRLFIFYSGPFNPDEEDYANYLSEIILDEDIEMKVLLIIQKEKNCHNGGRMAFGPDGYLYLALGDGCPQEDPENVAQDLSTVLGKVLRLDVSISGTWKAPPDNPFLGLSIGEGKNKTTALSSIYALGFRNPWGLSFSQDGRLFLADVGYSSREELDIVTKGGNYGWSLKEGTMVTSFGQGRNLTKTPLIDPIFEYSHDWIKSLEDYGPEKVPSKRAIAIIGGYLLEDGSYICGDLSGLVLRLKEENNIWKIIDVKTLDKYVKAFARDLDGHVYVLTSDDISPYSLGQVYLVR